MFFSSRSTHNKRTIFREKFRVPFFSHGTFQKSGRSRHGFSSSLRYRCGHSNRARLWKSTATCYFVPGKRSGTVISYRVYSRFFPQHCWSRLSTDSGRRKTGPDRAVDRPRTLIETIAFRTTGTFENNRHLFDKNTFPLVNSLLSIIYLPNPFSNVRNYKSLNFTTVMNEPTWILILFFTFLIIVAHLSDILRQRSITFILE